MATSVVRLFDPWRNPLCTCPPKYGLNPYTGCGHHCKYCYITSYVRDGFNPRLKENLLSRVKRDLEKIPRGSTVALSNSSDPYTPPEGRLGVTREVLRLLLERGHRVLVVTKSPLVLRDLDILTKHRDRVVVQVTITTLDRELASALEPHAPGGRVEAVRRLAGAGLAVGVRLDPIVPHLNDGEIDAVVRAAAEAGARHVVASVYKAKWDNFARLTAAFPELAPLWRDMYLKRGRRVHGQWYAPVDYRRRVLTTAAEAARSWRLQFSICREEFTELNTPGAFCDGSHFFNFYKSTVG